MSDPKPYVVCVTDKESNVMKNTSRMETAELIQLVRQHPCLWDRSEPQYRNRLEKDKAWNVIYRAMEPSYDDMSRSDRAQLALILNRKWCNIRDCYKKYLNGTSRVNVSGRPYLYAEHLTFLDRVYASRELTRKRKRKHADTKDSTGEPDADYQEEWLSEVFVDMAEAPDTEDEPGPARNVKTEFSRAKDSLDTEEGGIVSVLVNLIEKEEDEDRAFFKSITPTVKSLSDSDKFVFRIQVMKLLNALKKREKLNLKSEKLPEESDTE